MGNWRSSGGERGAESGKRNRTGFPFFVFRFLAVLGLLVLAGCAANEVVPPTRLPVAELPTITPVTAVPTPFSPDSANSTETTPAADSPAVTGTAVPTPNGLGIRPEAVAQQFVPDAGPAPPPERRPPPYEPPLSLHPDDHYWMIRPLPSNHRNYDLEWYPFGNDVMIPELAPYRIHHGMDFPNDSGTTVWAAAPGEVVYAGPLPSPRNGVNYYGNTVIIKHDWQWQGKDVYTLYAHTLELFVEVGDHVEQGQLIAGVGETGEVSGPHLHFEVRVGGNGYGDTRNPALWLAPFTGYGTLAGRFVDRRGRFIPHADISLTPVDAEIDTNPRRQRTYDLSVRSDEVWRENFVIGDLPAGRYRLLVTIDDISYRRDVTVYPGRTTFEIISTLFNYDPPPPTATPEATPTLAGEEPAEE